MQRTFVAISLALAFSCAFAVFTPTNYVKTPVQVVQNNETNYTNVTGGIGLGSLVNGELDLVAQSVTVNTGNASNNGFAVVYRKLDAKVLTSTANATLGFNGSLAVSYSNGYAISLNTDNSSGAFQVSVNQYPVAGGNGLALITLTNNTQADFRPYSKLAVVGKTGVVFYTVWNSTTNTSTQLNFTTFTVGGTTKGSLLATLTNGYTGSLQTTWGEALGSNQLYANWIEGTDSKSLKYSTVDVSKGTVNATAAASWDNKTNCQPFSTDKKWYGDFCYWINSTENVNTINYWIRYNSSTVMPFNSQPNVTLFTNTSTLNGIYSYGPYLAVFYTDSVSNVNSTTHSYELWNLDSLTTFKNKTTFLVTDIPTTLFKVQSAGLYSLTFSTNDSYANPNSTATHFTGITVGQVLSGSYITSVLGFIMTIVAGVLLF